MSELRRAIEPLVAAIGASIVEPGEAQDSDVVLSWNGSPDVAIRLDMHQALAGMITSVESELGGPLTELDRAGKQAAVRILEDRGAFAIRRAIEHVADSMCVSRITIYNYLNAIRES